MTTLSGTLWRGRSPEVVLQTANASPPIRKWSGLPGSDLSYG